MEQVRDREATFDKLEDRLERTELIVTNAVAALEVVVRSVGEIRRLIEEARNV